ncbi:hypothetical protein B7463_g12291, partial [Scytalidium lignicola]
MMSLGDQRPAQLTLGIQYALLTAPSRQYVNQGAPSIKAESLAHTVTVQGDATVKYVDENSMATYIQTES